MQDVAAERQRRIEHSNMVATHIERAATDFDYTSASKRTRETE